MWIDTICIQSNDSGWRSRRRFLISSDQKWRKHDTRVNALYFGGLDTDAAPCLAQCCDAHWTQGRWCAVSHGGLFLTSWEQCATAFSLFSDHSRCNTGKTASWESFTVIVKKGKTQNRLLAVGKESVAFSLLAGLLYYIFKTLHIAASCGVEEVYESYEKNWEGLESWSCPPP